MKQSEVTLYLQVIFFFFFLLFLLFLLFLFLFFPFFPFLFFSKRNEGVPIHCLDVPLVLARGS